MLKNLKDKTWEVTLVKVMFIVYHDIRTNARSQEMLECAQKLGNEVVLVSYSTPLNAQNVRCVVTGRGQRRYFPFIFLL